MNAPQRPHGGGPERVLMAAYSAVLGLGLVASAPWWLLRMATTSRYREGLRERLGKVPGRLREAVAAKRVVWVHAVSVGEVLAVSRLVGELEAALNEGAAQQPWRVVVSTTTRTGQALARERFGAERVFYFPLDLGWAVRTYVRALRPSLVVLAESELWPRMLHESERAGVPVAVVNARVSDRSFRRSMWLRGLWARMARGVTLWLSQSEEDARRLVTLGARADVVRVSGNLKYDVRAPKESRLARLIREIAAGRPILVAGSTVEGEPMDEDRLLIQAWEGPLRRDLHAVLVLAPRHPERFADVHAVSLEFPAVTATELMEGGSKLRHGSMMSRPEAQIEVIVLNTIGDLASVYGIADVAFVGGSLVAGGGGHNPLEPAQFGVPVVMGSEHKNFRGVVEDMKAADAIRIVDSLPFTEAGGGDSKLERVRGLRDALRVAIEALLRDPASARAIGERGRIVFEREGGATARSIEALMPLVRTPNDIPASEAVPA